MVRAAYQLPASRIRYLPPFDGEEEEEEEENEEGEEEQWSGGSVT